MFLKPGELIIKTGLVDKRKGLFAKRRQLVLTDTPRLLYIDPVEKVCKGEIPWSEDLQPQCKNAGTFFIQTVWRGFRLRCGVHGDSGAHFFFFFLAPQPSRTYYLEDIEKMSFTWVDTIMQVRYRFLPFGCRRVSHAAVGRAQMLRLESERDSRA